jgi:alpha-L-fucosidase 2
VARVSYAIEGVRYTREVFVSAPDQVVVVRLGADRPGRLSFSASLGRLQDAAREVEGPGRMTLAGRLGGEGGLAFQASLLVLPEGGRHEAFLERTAVEGADAATLLLAAATSFRGGDPRAECERRLREAAARGYERLKADHVADHQRLFRRVALRLGPAAGRAGVDELPTNERLERVKGGARARSSTRSTSSSGATC